MNINDIIKTRRAIYPSQYEKGEVKKSFIKLLLEIQTMVAIPFSARTLVPVVDVPA